MGSKKGGSMYKIVFYSLLILLFTFTGCGKKLEDRVQTVNIDGIKHIQNPAEPLKGTVILEVEKKLVINPYEQEDVGMRYFYSVKDKNGEIILFDPNRSEAHRFSGTGEYLGSLINHGQSPGEFVPMQVIHVYFINNQIWVTGGGKLAKFDRQGQFIDELKTGDSGMSFVDRTCYVTRKFSRSEKGSLYQYMIRRLSEDRAILDGPVLMEGLDIGTIRNESGTGGFSDGWGTPNIGYTVDTERKKVFLVYTPEYKITAKDVDGNTLYVIEKPHEPVQISRQDKEEMLGSFIESPKSSWILSAYPDRLNAVYEMTMLPGGYLGVYRISGIRETEIDVFDPEGRFVYILQLPEDLALRFAAFYDFGFSNMEYQEDFPVYCEYRINNLPEIFND